MNQNVKALLIGCVGAAISLSAYSQTLVSPSHLVTLGFLILVFALLIREGAIYI